MKCKWSVNFKGVCTNGACPYRGDVCPTRKHPEVCKYAEKAPLPELNAEELVTTLRICAGTGCKGCPCDCVELDESCDVYVMRQAADMLEKLIKKEGNQNDHPTL